jgi:hypothetical protein
MRGKERFSAPGKGLNFDQRFSAGDASGSTVRKNPMFLKGTAFRPSISS